MIVQADAAVLPQGPSATGTAAQPVSGATPERAEERLRRTDELRGKGLLSDEEYLTLRRRILDTL